MIAHLWPIERPIPYADNPRNNQNAIEKVAASLLEFGWQQPIVVDREGVVVVGHTRLAAAKRLSLREVPVVIAEHLTPQQVKAYRIADNRTHEEATWDDALLVLEIEELAAAGYDTSLTGFDASELEERLAAFEDEEEAAPSAGPQAVTLVWEEHEVPLTEQEADQLTQRFQAHLVETGLAYGFVRRLLTSNGSIR